MSSSWKDIEDNVAFANNFATLIFAEVELYLEMNIEVISHCGKLNV